MNIAQTIPLADSWGMHGDIGTGWWVVMMVAMVLFWGAVLFGIAWLIRGTVRGSSATPEGRVSRESPVDIVERRLARESPVDILERRFAEGAISVEDYRARREVLLHGSGEANSAPGDEAETAPPAQQRRP